MVEFPTAVVASDRAFDRLHAVDDGETIRANVSVIPLHLAAFERQRVIRLLTGDSEVGAGCLPFRAVGIDPAAATALVGDEVGELVFQSAPQLLWLAVPELRIELDGPVRPPSAAGGGLHPGVP